MRIVIKPAGVIRMYVPEKTMDVPAGLTIDQISSNLPIPAALKLLFFVNGISKAGCTVLNDGDEIRIVARMTGG